MIVHSTNPWRINLLVNNARPNFLGDKLFVDFEFKVGKWKTRKRDINPDEDLNVLLLGVSQCD